MIAGDSAQRWSLAEDLDDRSRTAGASRTDRTRLRLLASIARVLGSGTRPEDIKVADITAGAGVAHGTYYRYFADTPSGIAALLEDFSGFLRARLESASAAPPGGPEWVRDIVRARVRLFRDNPALMGCLLGPAGDNSEAGRARAFEWAMRIAATIAKARSADGGERLPPASLLPLAYALDGMVDAFLARIYLRRDADLAELANDEDNLADFLTGLWCRGAYAAEGAEGE